MNKPDQTEFASAVADFERAAIDFQLYADPNVVMSQVNDRTPEVATMFDDTLEAFTEQDPEQAAHAVAMGAMAIASFRTRLGLMAIGRVARCCPEADKKSYDDALSVFDGATVTYTETYLSDDPGDTLIKVTFSSMHTAQGEQLGTLQGVDHSDAMVTRSLDVFVLNATNTEPTERRVFTNIGPTVDADSERAWVEAQRISDDPQRVMDYLYGYYRFGMSTRFISAPNSPTPFVIDETSLNSLVAEFYQKGVNASHALDIKNEFGTDPEDIKFFEHLITPA